jgi:hypothetical protein
MFVPEYIFSLQIREKFAFNMWRYLIRIARNLRRFNWMRKLALIPTLMLIMHFMQAQNEANSVREKLERRLKFTGKCH